MHQVSRSVISKPGHHMYHNLQCLPPSWSPQPWLLGAGLSTLSLAYWWRSEEQSVLKLTKAALMHY